MAKTSHTYQSVMRDLKAKHFAPVYVLYGEETYFIDQVAHYIEHHVLTEGERGFNQTVFYGKDVDCKTIAAAARRFPMMASHQVILVKEAQNLKQWDDLSSYLEKPLDSTILVLCIKGKGPDKRTKAGKLMDSHVAMESKRLYENQIPSWVESYLAEKGVRCNEKGLMLIAESLGNDLSRIANELDKMLLNHEGKKELNEKDVSESIGINRDFNVFELQSALARKDFKKCIQILNYFSSSKNAFGKPVVLLGSLYSWFSKVLMVHGAASRDERSIASAIGVNPFFVKEYLLAARNFPPRQLEHIFGLLLDADLKAKGVGGGSEDDDALLKELFLKILVH
ncbi:MAG: DNA polymerase III subunit delta [Bacteroidota bacterium]|nr:DNA polymerase III subunit delta [Bacteroidota bacterium]MDX5429845.1 DNA polymerase III subunit delta [Bacteroidota bacterium]MDX5468624.1 DNA polymerase III subunit delta [Bacteroidota bacterium]